MLDTAFLFAEVNLPSIPKDLLIFSDSPIKDVDDIGYGLEHIKNGQSLKASGYKLNTTDYTPLLAWLHSNIPGINDLQKITMQTQTAQEQNRTHIVHSDLNRVYALNYILNTGGPDVTNNWYLENNMPLRRTKPDGYFQQSDTGPVKYDNLKVLGSARFKKHKWYLIATDILHDVDNIVNDRSSITISFFDRTILDTLNKMKLLTNINEYQYDPRP
jgi:hypothetical protein